VGLVDHAIDSASEEERQRAWRELLLAGYALPALPDTEEARLPADLPPVIDAHVHLFPDRMFEAIWSWFDRHAWPIRYRLQASDVIAFLLSRGVAHLVVLQYAHKPGIARELNRWMVETCRAHPRVTGLATVFPGEPDAVGILEEAFDLGLAGVKLHCHVQRASPDDPAMHAIYEVCAARAKPLLIHASREPKSSAYHCDPHALCGAEKVERVLRDHPRLRLCIPHLGVDEFDAYGTLLERYDNLWLDTTMMLADYLPYPWPSRLLHVRPERLIFGTDFPNLPYAWDREIRRLRVRGLKDVALAQLLSGTACALYGLPRSIEAGAARADRR